MQRYHAYYNAQDKLQRKWKEDKNQRVAFAFMPA